MTSFYRACKMDDETSGFLFFIFNFHVLLFVLIDNRHDDRNKMLRMSWYQVEIVQYNHHELQ